MPQPKYGSPRITAREFDLSGQTKKQPTGVPAGVIGTANRGPAYVPVTVGTYDEFAAQFGGTDGVKFGPYAAQEWLRNQTALTYLRVLGVGDGKTRNSDGSVTSAGFTVGEREPNAVGLIDSNPYANLGGPLGRTYFLGCFMSESFGSTALSAAGLQADGKAVPIVRGVVMAPSGVILRLSASSGGGTNTAPSSGLVASDTAAAGQSLGAAVLLDGGITKQEFVLLLNGHKGTDPQYPNVLTASFDLNAPNYFGNVFNTDPTKYQQAGHYLYARWDVHPALATVTGSQLLSSSVGAGASTAARSGAESSAFIMTSSLGRDVGSSTVPNYEAFTDRFAHARTPWIVSQKFGGVAHNLFRLWALDAGNGVSTNYKISIENLGTSTDQTNLYGTFDLVIRDWNDNDQAAKPLEQWRGLTLDPSSDRYIAKVIGDVHSYYEFDTAESNQRPIVDGNYDNQSRYVRVEMDQSVDNGDVDAVALPFGFRGHMHLVTSGTAPMAQAASSDLLVSDALKRLVQVPVPMRDNVTIGTGTKKSANPQFYWGVQFEHKTTTTQPNASILANKSLLGFAKYFPEHLTTVQSMLAGDNAGAAPTAANGVMDSDVFNNNYFSLENVQVVTASNGTADPAQWVNAMYVRDGSITTNHTNKTRRASTVDLTQANRKYFKFSLFLQGGFNGTNLFDLNESLINDAAITADMSDSNRGLNLGPSVKAYTKALEVMKNTSNVDIQLLVTPGVRHPIVTDAAIEAVQERYDALYVMDIQELDTNGTTVTSSIQVPSVSQTAQNFADRGIDSSFGAAYFPDQVVYDSNIKTNVIVPPSTVVLGAMALNDKLAFPWFAPAGTTRGALQSVIEPRVMLSQDNMDVLYDVNINPIVAFPSENAGGLNAQGGVVIWGQRTLQQAASDLDRVNVRRLLINIRRQIRDISRQIIFEPNREATLAQFSALIRPRLERIQAQKGVDKFKVVIDSSTTTQADIDNNTLRGVIFVKPIKSIEYVTLDFVVTNDLNGVG